MLRRVAGCLARLAPVAVDPSEDLERSLDALDVRVRPETVVRAGYGAGVLLAPLVPVAAWLAPPGATLAAGCAALALALGTVHGVHSVPGVLAAARRRRALGAAPTLVSRAVLRMRLAPSPETAAAFAARTGTGPLAASLREHVDRARGTPQTGLDGFATEWAHWFPALGRAMALVESAGSAPPAERDRTLDRALEATLDGTRDRMAEYAASLRGPATALYAFGVLLPLALVAMVPAARTAGLAVSVPALVLMYDVALPAALAAAAAWLLARRPVAAPPPAVPRTHPDLPDRRWPPVAVGVLVVVGTAAVSTRFLPGWVGPVAAVGAGTGSLLVARYRAPKAVAERVRGIERGLPDALYLIGRRVADGGALESALERAASETSGDTGAVLADAAHRQRELGAGVGEAFLGRHGALETVPSPRFRGAAALLELAAVEGRPAGDAVVEMADHVAALQAVERRARREVGEVTSTLRHTAAVFGPLVAGTTVAMAEGMGTSGPLLSGSPLSTPTIGTAVGVYVLLLAALLSALATGLTRGLDRALVGYNAGVALLSATGVFVASYLVAALLI